MMGIVVSFIGLLVLNCLFIDNLLINSEMIFLKEFLFEYLNIWNSLYLGN